MRWGSGDLIIKNKLQSLWLCLSDVRGILRGHTGSDEDAGAIERQGDRRRSKHHNLWPGHQMVLGCLWDSQLCHGWQTLDLGRGRKVRRFIVWIHKRPKCRGNVEERKLGDHDPGTVLSSSVRVTSNTVVDGERTVVMTRPFKGKTPDHFTFDASSSEISVITASGSGPSYAYHGPKQR